MFQQCTGSHVKDNDYNWSRQSVMKQGYEVRWRIFFYNFPHRKKKKFMCFILFLERAEMCVHYSLIYPT